MDSLRYSLNEAMSIVSERVTSIVPTTQALGLGSSHSEVCSDDDKELSSHRTSCSEDCNSESNDLSTSDADENYFAVPLNDSHLQSIDEIEEAIEKVKVQVLDTEGISNERLKLVQRLVGLRLRLQYLKEIQEEQGDAVADEYRLVNQHQFFSQTQLIHRTPQYCDRCGGIIWTLIQYWYRCSGCAYQCHSKCLNNVPRSCQSVNVGVDVEYEYDICPEVGLADQNYACYECKTRFTLKNSWMEPRRCDYNGKYYCPQCHKNVTVSIPARILRNWDFTAKPVAEVSRQFLKLMSSKPNINVDKLNPKLYTFVEELGVIKGMREDIIIMKDFFRTCRTAISQKLLRRLEVKQHFVETSYMYSLDDLLEIQNGRLLKFLNAIHQEYIKHIKEECMVCKGKGFICEICENIQEIFPFDSATQTCPSCYAVFHSICFSKKAKCPKCIRIANRKAKTELN